MPLMPISVTYLRIVSASGASRPKLYGAITPICTPAIVESGFAARPNTAVAPNTCAAGTARAILPNCRLVSIGQVSSAVF